MLENSIYIALAVFFISLHVDAYNVRDVIKLKKALLEGHDKFMAPYADHDWNVIASIFVTGIASLDEKVEKLTTNMELYLDWYDDTMSWNETETGIHEIYFDKKEVWVPELFVVNKHSQISFEIEETSYLPVRYLPKELGFFIRESPPTLICNLDTSGFPFDRHTCDIQLEANKFRVHFTASLNESVLAITEPDGYWDVINKPTLSFTHFEDFGSSITINITLARKPTFFMINLILPMTLLALLSPLVFLLPNNSGERVAFSITVLLAISVFMTIISGHVPPKSQPFPLVLTMLFISYSLMITVVIVVFINERVCRLPEHVGIPRPLVWLSRFTRLICCYFRRRHTVVYGVATTAVDNESENDTKSQRRVVQEKKVTWKDISWTIDMICMTLLFTLQLVIIIVFLINAQVKK